MSCGAVRAYGGFAWWTIKIVYWVNTIPIAGAIERLEDAHFEYQLVLEATRRRNRPPP